MMLYNDEDLNKLERLLATIYFWLTSESNAVRDDILIGLVWSGCVCILLLMATYM